MLWDSYHYSLHFTHEKAEVQVFLCLAEDHTDSKRQNCKLIPICVLSNNMILPTTYMLFVFKKVQT